MSKLDQHFCFKHGCFIQAHAPELDEPVDVGGVEGVGLDDLVRPVLGVHGLLNGNLARGHHLG